MVPCRTGGSQCSFAFRLMPGRACRVLLDQAPAPERCLEAHHLYRTQLELIAERTVRRRQLSEDGNAEISGRDLRDRNALMGRAIEVAR